MGPLPMHTPWSIPGLRWRSTLAASVLRGMLRRLLRPKLVNGSQDERPASYSPRAFGLGYAVSLPPRVRARRPQRRSVPSGGQGRRGVPVLGRGDSARQGAWATRRRALPVPATPGRATSGTIAAGWRPTPAGPARLVSSGRRSPCSGSSGSGPVCSTCCAARSHWSDATAMTRLEQCPCRTLLACGRGISRA